MGRWFGWWMVIAATPGCADAAGRDTGEGSGAQAGTSGSTGGSSSGAGESTAPGESTAADSSSAPASTAGGDDACDGEWATSGAESSATSGGSAEDTNAGMGGDIPIGVTVFDLRRQEIDAGFLIEMTDVVVTAPPVAYETGSLLFVQAPAGGEYSGITVETSTPLEGVVLGDRVRVVGRVTTLDEFTRIVVDGDVEEVVVDGTAALPEPMVVDLGALTDPSVDLGPLEAALIRVPTPEVTDDDVCPGEFALTAELRVDDLFLGELAPTPATGSTFTAIVGPLRYTADGFEVAPRTLDDLIP